MFVAADLGDDTIVEYAIDISGRKRMEDELRDARDYLDLKVKERTVALEAEAVRRTDLVRRLATAQEDERRRVARDLHDTVGQLMTGLSLALKGIETSGKLAPPTVSRLAEAQQVLNELG